MYIVLHTDSLVLSELKFLVQRCTPVIFQEQQRCVLSPISDQSINTDPLDPMMTSKIINALVELSAKNIRYIALTSNIGIANIMLRLKLRFIHYPVDTDPEKYLTGSFKLLDTEVLPIIGYSRNPIQNSAGILPLIYHEGQIFCALGIDSYRHKYSDFGGGYDQIYTKHKKDTYKNTILQGMQIRNGEIDPDILIDHFMSFENKDMISSMIIASGQRRDEGYGHDTMHDAMHDDRAFGSGSSGGFRMMRSGSDPRFHNRHDTIGKGDPNTKYTAFRELMEETAYVNNDGTIGYTFDLLTIYTKLYTDRAFVYLGGDRIYGYDMYLVFLTLDELTPQMRTGFLESYTAYKQNPELYTRQRMNGPTKSNIQIRRNKEMIGVDIIPLNYLVSKTKAPWLDRFKNEPKTQDKCETVYGERYGSDILDAMRPCFASAMIKYHKELESIDVFSEVIISLFDSDISDKR